MLCRGYTRLTALRALFMRTLRQLHTPQAHSLAVCSLATVSFLLKFVLSYIVSQISYEIKIQKIENKI
jgi:hypothetical protein